MGCKLCTEPENDSINNSINIPTNSILGGYSQPTPTNSKCCCKTKPLDNPILLDNQKDSRNILKSNIIYNLKLKKEQIRNKTLLTKYFIKWKMRNKIYKKQRDKTICLINNFLRKIIKRKKEKLFFNKMKIIKHKYYLGYLTKILYRLYRAVE